jgi:membrane associated rhomboid family serine protease
MLTLFFFGSVLEVFFSELEFILLYLVAIIISDIPTVFKHKDNINYRSLGASGGVSAILFGSIIIHPLNPIYLFFIPIGIPGFIFGGLYIAYTYWQDKRSADHINHSAHLIGALFGIIAILILIPESGALFLEKIKSFSF